MFKYRRRQPENTLFYQIIKKHYSSFKSHLEEQGTILPCHVQREFEDFSKCGLLTYGFLRVRCQDCHHERLIAFSCKRRGFCPSCCAKRMIESTALLVDKILPYQPIRQWVLSVPYPLRLLFAKQPIVLGKVLGIVHRAIATYLIKKTGFTHKIARTGAVTFIQRFGSALNLNVHFHMLFLDGVYKDSKKQAPRFISIKQHSPSDIINLTHKISLRIARYLERTGIIERDLENSYFSENALDDDAMNEHQHHSIHYRISIGPHKGRKVFSLQTLPPASPEIKSKELLGEIAGFSLHAGVVAKANQRNKLERLCGYISRPAIAMDRLSLTEEGDISYELKTPYRNGTTHIIFEPLDFISKLAALVPVPSVHLIRFHGLFAPNSKLRPYIVPKNNSLSKEIKGKSNKHTGMTWTERLKRTFKIDINICERCDGKAKVIACIYDPKVINKILTHLESHPVPQIKLPFRRAPPKLQLTDV